jgi:hypothetical protein
VSEPTYPRYSATVEQVARWQWEIDCRHDYRINTRRYAVTRKRAERKAARWVERRQRAQDRREASRFVVGP